MDEFEIFKTQMGKLGRWVACLIQLLTLRFLRNSYCVLIVIGNVWIYSKSLYTVYKYLCTMYMYVYTHIGYLYCLRIFILLTKYHVFKFYDFETRTTETFLGNNYLGSQVLNREHHICTY